MTRRWIVLIVMTMVVVVAWIFTEVYLGFIDKSAEVDYLPYMEPISPEMNTETLDEIQQREEERLPVERSVLE